MNINSVTLIGRVTQDPVSRSFADSKKFLTKFTVATSNKPSKYRSAETEFHPVVAFGKLALMAKDYLHKGRLIYVTGSLHVSRWEDSNHILHAKTEVYAEQILLLDKQPFLAEAIRDNEIAKGEAPEAPAKSPRKSRAKKVI